MVIKTKVTCLNNRMDTNRKAMITSSKVMSTSNHPTDMRKKDTATKRKIMDISDHLMENTSKRGTATKTKTITITKTMGTKNNLTEDTMKRITDMSKMGMVMMIKSTDISK